MDPSLQWHQGQKGLIDNLKPFSVKMPGASSLVLRAFPLCLKTGEIPAWKKIWSPVPKYFRASPDIKRVWFGSELGGFFDASWFHWREAEQETINYFWNKTTKMALGMEEKTARKNNKRNSKEQVREMGKRNGKEKWERSERNRTFEKGDSC